MSTSVSTEQLEIAGSDGIKFTGSQINYYFICKRKLWLFSHNIELEPESDLVKLGKLLHENRYQRRKLKEVQIDRIKVDFMESRRTSSAEGGIQTSDDHLIPPEESAPSSLTAATPPPSNLSKQEDIKHEERVQEAKTGTSGGQSTAPPQKELVIHEVKRSKKMQDAHLYQLLYYMYYLKTNYRVNVQRGVLHYPLLGQNVEVLLSEERIRQIEQALQGMTEVNSLPNPEEAVWKGYCRSCAYCDLCWG